MAAPRSPTAELHVGWTEHDGGSKSAGWADPLGLRGEAGGVASDLVPVFRRRHNTPEQFGLFCYALRSTQQDPINRLLAVSRIWALACADQDRSWAGQRRATQALVSASEYDLSQPLMSDELRTGLWASNRGAAGQLGLIERNGVGARLSPRDYDLTSAGKDMAKVFEARFIAAGKAKSVAKRIGSSRCVRADLRMIRAHNAEGARSLAAILSAQLQRRPIDHAMASALHQVPREGSLLTPGILWKSRTLLTDRQRDALPRARSLNVVIRQVEGPFRRWMTGRSDDAPRPGLWDEGFWDRLAWSPAAARVRAAGRNGSGWRGLVALAHRLTAHREVPFPERHGFRPGWHICPPEKFRLDTFTALLDAGLLDEP